jgi:hypothetical protein
MPEDAARDTKTRLRADLRTALKEGRALEAKVIRSLVAAIDNAEAPPSEEQTDPGNHSPRGRSGEVERLLLSGSEVREVLSAEIHERERAAEELERLGVKDRAEALRSEALLARRYLD